MAQRLAEALLRTVPKTPAQPSEEPEPMAELLAGCEQENAASVVLDMAWHPVGLITDERAREVWSAISEPDRARYLRMARKKHGKKFVPPQVN